jgi:uncharacterized protein (TIGR02171 family)
MMRFFRLFILIAIVPLFWACTDSVEKLSQPNVPNVPEDYDYAENDQQHMGMVVIHSAGHSVFLGTDDTLSTSRERPRMKVEFTYDYSISAHEITHAEYAEVMGGAADEINRFLPIRNITYYDAVLMANKKSIREGYDTVYSYTQKNFNNVGNCINLADLVFHPDVEGYRLPTEAEWVYAASLDFVPEASWNGGNSGYDLHDYCTKGARSSGLCDMEGNVKEWVNDWLGFFRDTTVVNYVGAPDGGSLGERILKGGSYRDDIASINLYSRGDIYTVTSSTLAPYVGYRLAFGVIPDPVWLSENGVATTSRVFPSATSMNVRTKTGTFHSKLAFRNENSGNIAFIDYMNGTLSVLEIADTIDSYHPDISPDGSKVAFCTKAEGVPGTSALYVRDLKAVDSRIVRLDVESAAIPRWGVTDAGDTVIVYVTDCGTNDDEVSWKAQSTWQVKFSGGKFGKPKKLFDGTYNGGVSDDRKLAISGARLLRARMSDKDSLWYGGKQACNASLAKDGSKRTVFLDFGEKSSDNFVGEPYKVHERILVADSTGKLIQSVKAPEGYTFDHVEWASNTNLVVGTLVSTSGNHSQISLTDLGDSSTIILAESDELWHPCLWVNPDLSASGTGNVNVDSAGMYYSDRLSYYSVELRVKMENFWTRMDSVTAVAMGSSRMLFGLYEKQFTSVNMLNMAYSSGDLYGAEYLLKNYMFNHLPHLKYLVLEISPDMFWRTADESWNPVVNTAVGYAYDANHGFWVDSIPDGFIEAVKDAPKPIFVLMHPYDFENFLLPSTSWYTPDVAVDTMGMNLDDAIVDVNMKLFESIVNMCKKHKVTVVALVIPRHAGYKDTGAFGIYGPRRSVTKKLFETLQKYDVVWMDENEWGDHDYQDESMGYNMDHLSYIGAYKMSERVDAKLKGL